MDRMCPRHPSRELQTAYALGVGFIPNGRHCRHRPPPSSLSVYFWYFTLRQWNGWFAPIPLRQNDLRWRDAPPVSWQHK